MVRSSIFLFPFLFCLFSFSVCCLRLTMVIWIPWNGFRVEALCLQSLTCKVMIEWSFFHCNHCTADDDDLVYYHLRWWSIGFTSYKPILIFLVFHVFHVPQMYYHFIHVLGQTAVHVACRRCEPEVLLYFHRVMGLTQVHDVTWRDVTWRDVTISVSFYHIRYILHHYLHTLSHRPM